MTKQRYTVKVPNPYARINLGEAVPADEGGGWGFPGYTMRTKFHFYTEVGGNAVWQTTGNVWHQTKANWNIYVSGKSHIAASGTTTLSTGGNMTVASGVGQGAAWCDRHGTKVRVDRFNALKLWDQVYQHNRDLQWFLGDDSDWEDLIEGEDEPCPDKPDATAQAPEGGVFAEGGWFGKRTAWTGQKLGVSLHDQSQDLRGAWAEDIPITKYLSKFKLGGSVKMIGAHPFGISKNTGSYPAITSFDPYPKPKFIGTILKFRDLAVRVVDDASNVAVIKQANNVIKTADTAVTTWNKFVLAIDPIVGTWAGPQGAWADAFWKSLGWTFHGAFQGSSPTTNPQAEITSADETYDLPDPWELDVFTEQNETEHFSLSAASVPCNPATTDIAWGFTDMNGRHGFYFESDTGGGVVSFNIATGSTWDWGRAAATVSRLLGNNGSSSAGTTSNTLKSVSLGAAGRVSLRALTDSEWMALPGVPSNTTPAEATQQANDSYQKLTGSLTPITVNGADGPADPDAVTASELAKIISSGSPQNFTAICDGATVTLTSNHGALKGSPSVIRASVDTAAGLGGKEDRKESDLEEADDQSPLGGLIDRGKQSPKAALGAAGAVVNPLQQARKLVKPLEHAVNDCGEAVGSLVTTYEKLATIAVGKAGSNRVGIFSPSGITMATAGATVAHSRKGFCFVASAAGEKATDWDSSEKFIKAYKVVRKLEKKLAWEKYFGALPEYGQRDLGFRVRAAHDVDLISARVSTLAAIGNHGLARVIGGHAAEMVAFDNIAIAARDKESRVEILGGRIVIGGANTEDHLLPDQIAYSDDDRGVQHKANKERIGDGVIRGNADLAQDLTKIEKSDIEEDGEEVEVWAWADYEDTKPAAKDDCVQQPTQEVAMAAKESVSVEVGKFAVVVKKDRINIFARTEEPTHSPGAAGWVPPDDPGTVASLSFSEKGIDMRFNNTEGLCLYDGAAIFTGGDCTLAFEGGKVELTNGDDKGIAIDSSGLSYLDGGKATPLFDGQKIVANIQSMAPPKPGPMVAKKVETKEKKKKSDDDESSSTLEETHKTRKKSEGTYISEIKAKLIEAGLRISEED